MRWLPSEAVPASACRSSSSDVRRYLFPALIVLNVLLLLRLLGITPAVLPEPSDPGRLARQINPDQVSVQPLRR